jgi:hypothetical protein
MHLVYAGRYGISTCQQAKVSGATRQSGVAGILVWLAVEGKQLHHKLHRRQSFGALSRARYVFLDKHH